MGFCRQEYRSGLPFLTPGALPSPEAEPMSPESPALQVASLALRHPGTLFLLNGMFLIGTVVVVT